MPTRWAIQVRPRMRRLVQNIEGRAAQAERLSFAQESRDPIEYGDVQRWVQVFRKTRPIADFPHRPQHV